MSRLPEEGAICGPQGLRSRALQPTGRPWGQEPKADEMFCLRREGVFSQMFRAFQLEGPSDDRGRPSEPVLEALRGLPGKTAIHLWGQKGSSGGMFLLFSVTEVGIARWSAETVKIAHCRLSSRSVPPVDRPR